MSVGVKRARRARRARGAACSARRSTSRSSRCTIGTRSMRRPAPRCSSARPRRGRGRGADATCRLCARRRHRRAQAGNDRLCDAARRRHRRRAHGVLRRRRRAAGDSRCIAQTSRQNFAAGALRAARFVAAVPARGRTASSTWPTCSACVDACRSRLRSSGDERDERNFPRTRIVARARSACSRRRQALLALADGTVFRGRSIGATAMRVGEVVFNTAMTGYQEILTDPVVLPARSSR